MFQLDTCILGSECLKFLYASDEDFGELYLSFQKHPKDDFLVQDGHLLKVRDYVSPSVELMNCLFERYVEDH